MSWLNSQSQGPTTSNNVGKLSDYIFQNFAIHFSPNRLNGHVLLTSLLTIALCFTTVLSNNCRCTFGSQCWPSDSEFQTLASQVSQPLIYLAPPATPCHNSASGNRSDVRSGWSNDAWRSDHPGATEFSNWESYTFPNGTTQACYFNTTLGVPCQRASYRRRRQNPKGHPGSHQIRREAQSMPRNQEYG
jgi:hypothetical protein